MKNKDKVDISAFSDIEIQTKNLKTVSDVFYDVLYDKSNTIILYNDDSFGINLGEVKLEKYIKKALFKVINDISKYNLYKDKPINIKTIVIHL